MSSSAPRYALYAAPPKASALHDFAARWLGWDPESGIVHPAMEPPGIESRRVTDLTSHPRRYGFHGTLKPPFRLRESRSEAELYEAVAAFAASRQAFAIPALRVAAIGRFLALVPSARSNELDRFAADCVRGFDHFRRPADEAELAKRRAAGLSARQEQYLLAWGYPYVLEEFRLHFTLTDRIADEAEHATFKNYLTEATAAFTAEDFALSEICLFKQASPEAGFRIEQRFALGR